MNTDLYFRTQKGKKVSFKQQAIITNVSVMADKLKLAQ